MQNSGPLVVLGIAILVLTAIVIVVPYMRGKSDILTAWNIVLLGGAMFMGVGPLAVAYGDFHWPELQWFQPTRSEVRKYVIGAIVFYVTLFFSYFILSWPKKISARFLNTWPPISLPLLFCSLVLFGVIAVVASFAGGVAFIGPLFFNISHKALLFAVVFSFCHWYQNKRQLAMLFLFLAVFVLSALDSMVVFHGRRLLLSVVAAPLICMYWLHWRYLSPSKNIIRLGIATALAFSAAVIYSAFRHFDMPKDSVGGRTFATTVQALENVQLEKAFASATNNLLSFFGQYCVHYSLLTIHLVDNGQIEVQPLNTLAFLATYPVPRRFWPNKPQALGVRIVGEILRLPYRTNWGLGIVANCYQEGGLLVEVLYAFLIVMGVRLLDDALVRQPTNIFLLGILCASAPHFAALIRGDPTTMAAEILEAFAFAWGLGLGLRMFFGTDNTRRTHAVTTAVRPLG